MPEAGGGPARNDAAQAPDSRVTHSRLPQVSMRSVATVPAIVR